MDFASDNLITNDFDPRDIKGLQILAQWLQVELPRGGSLDAMFKAFGPNRVFSGNIIGVATRMKCEPGIAPEPVREKIMESGVMDAIPMRNLSGPGFNGASAMDVFLLGGTAYWMELRIKELERQFAEGKLRINRIHALASRTRRVGAVEGSPEREHPVVQALYDESYHEVSGPQWPSEAMVMEQLIQEMFERTKLYAQVTRGEGDMEAQVRAFLKGRASFSLTNGIYVPGNAPAVQMPLQFFNVVRDLFTSLPPELMYFSQAGRRLATTTEELAPNGRQDPYAVLSVFPRLVAALIELNKSND